MDQSFRPAEARGRATSVPEPPAVRAAAPQASPRYSVDTLPGSLGASEGQRAALDRALVQVRGAVTGPAPAVQFEKDGSGTTATPAPTTLPTPLPGSVGTVGYYAARNGDFLRRCPTAPPSPPDYYLGYGDKYARRFTTVLKPQLSAVGKAWVDRTFVLLQQAIENRLAADPAAFDALERNPAAFRRFAYDTHPRAYLDGGLRRLPAVDLARIATTPDLGDLMTVDGVAQILSTATELVPQWGADALGSAERAGRATGRAIEGAWESVFGP